MPIHAGTGDLADNRLCPTDHQLISSQDKDGVRDRSIRFSKLAVFDSALAMPSICLFGLSIYFLLSLCSLSIAQNVTVYNKSVPFAPLPLALPAASYADEIAEAFANLGRTTIWKSIQNITLEGDTYEPEGMVRLGNDRFYVSTTETINTPTSYGNNTVINGTDRSPGSGFAHILLFDSNGSKIAQATYTQAGDIMYHLGGIDFDGERIWGTIAQYRPNTTARVVSFDPQTLKETSYFEYRDHLGGIVHDTGANEVYCLNWGARNASKFAVPSSCDSGSKTGGFVPAVKVTRNPSYFVDYQDCKFLGRPRLYDRRPTMLCSGLTDYGSGANKFQLGGVAIIDLETMLPLEVPITGLSALGVVLTQNPMDVAVVDGKLRFYWLPDQHNSTVYIYEAEPESPYEF